MTPFRINPTTGDLEFFELSATICPLSKWKHFPEQLRLLAGPENDMRTGWVWKKLSPLSFGGLPVAMALGYHDRRLEMLYFSVITESKDWPTYEESTAELASLTPVMEQQLGIDLKYGQAQLKWGCAFCSYDLKGGFTSAGLNYTHFG
jgi:hypothetical protein